MKAVIALLLFSTVSVSLFGQTFTIEKELSEVKFSIRNFGVTVNGEFHHVGGVFVLDEKDISASYFDAFVDAATVDTGIGLRDKHLKQEVYFDAKRNPLISVTSRQITRNGNQWSSVARITIKKITREASINFEMEKKDGMCVLTAMFKINRLDFEVGEDSFSLGDEVVIHLHIVGSQQVIAP